MLNNIQTEILQLIKENSNILEFGCGKGSLTRHMKEKLNCKIGIIDSEYDWHDTEASKCCELGWCLGSHNGDIEAYIWEEKFKDIKFDYILFSNILGKLINPKNVLRRCKSLLKNDGSVIISIPNFSHNQIIVDLLQEKFEYKKTEMPYISNLRFFTYFSLLQMIEDSDFFIENEKLLKYEGQCKNLEPAILECLKNRELGNVSDFIMELKCKNCQ